EADAVFLGFQAAAQAVTGPCCEAMSKSRVLDLNGTGAPQAAGDLIPDHGAEVIVNPFWIPVLEIGDSDSHAPIEDLRNILASRNTDLHRIALAFRRVILGQLLPQRRRGDADG